MSTVPDRKTFGLVPRKDPFRYGWRYVRRVLPDGNETFDQEAQVLEAIEARKRELQERIRRLRESSRG